MNQLVALAVFLFGATAIFGYSQLPQNNTMHVMFGGDVMLDRTVARHAARVGHEPIYAGVKELFEKADVRIVNLEGVISDQPSISQVDHTRLEFTFAPTLARDVLLGLNITAVSLANNHTDDFGREGFAQTKEYLQLFGVRSFGSFDNTELTTVLETKAGSLCLVGYQAFILPSVTPINQEIKRIRKECSRLVVFAHWGEEYETTSSLSQRAAAHAFIDAGADLVVGAHPHVVQEHEFYKGRAIFYSLGNFIFDQYFSYDTTHSVALTVEFTPGKTIYTLTPLAVVGNEVSVDFAASSTSITLANTGGKW